MIPRRKLPEPLLKLAEAQAGVLSIEQCEAFGITRQVRRRLARDQQLHRCGTRVWSLDAPPFTLTALCWAGTLMGGDDAAVGGLAAANLHGLTADAVHSVAVWVAASRQVAVAPGWTFHRDGQNRLGRRHGGPSRLSVEDVILDLAGELAEDALVAIVTRAVQQRRTTPQRIRRALTVRSQVSRRRFLEELVADTATGVESPLERRYLRDVERAHGLPRSVRQVSLRAHRRSDVDYPGYGLLVELDGRQGHEADGVFRDMYRDNDHLLADRRTAHYGWADITGRPCEVAEQVGQLLREGGWPGPVKPCSKCRAWRRFTAV